MPRSRKKSTARGRVRRMLRWLVRLRGSPHAIAGGFAIGVLVAFTPTVGLQAVLALVLATLFNANRPIAIVPIWITNPLTIPPIYAFTHYLGSFFWAGPDTGDVDGVIGAGAEELESLDPLSFGAQIEVFVDMGFDVFIPLWIGGLLLGGFAAAISYPLVFQTVVRLRERRAARRQRRNLRARAQR